ncbi:MAG: cysteine synthase A [Phocaeicola sp.]|nr:cysteine synthase A [Phocaeicola sp.]
MQNIKKQLTELIGKTPMVELSRISQSHNSQARIIAKLESFNPGGSAKDRIALSMIEDAEKSGKLKPGSTIIEPTSGNTGVGLAWISSTKNYKLILTMPETMSKERQLLLKAYGAQIILTPGKEGMKGAIEKANQLNKKINNSIILQQFNNKANPEAHYNTTAEEIWTDTDGQTDIFIACVGTGGTISGVGKKLKEKNSKIKIIAVEPDSSAVISGEKAGPHKIQGIGAGFIPNTLDTKIIDRVVRVKDEDAMSTGRELAIKEGILCGISSGAALHAAIKVSQEEENANKNIVVLLPDTGERYLSTELFNKTK